LEEEPTRSRAPALALRQVTKTFPAGGRTPSLKRLLRHPISAMHRPRVEVLRDVSFEVAQGEFFAIVGANGAGKSTLLRCMAGIYQPEGGEVEVRGRVAPFIDLGASFHPDLDARENVAMVGTLIGLSPAEARRRTPQTLRFAELQEFAEMQVKQYSSGMGARLAFAIALQSDAEVLLFDEALAVGDIAFREKCFGAFEGLKGAGRTVIYVSHQLETVSRFADRAMLLEPGAAPRIGDPATIIEEYERRSLATAGSGLRPGRLVDSATHPPSSSRERERPAGHSDRELPGGEWRRRLADTTVALTTAEYKIRYLDSVLGYLWALVQPLLMFAVLYFVLSRVVRFQDVSHYPALLLLGVVLFNHFTEATGLALPSLVVRANLLQRIAFPTVSVPVASALASAATFAVGLVLAMVFAIASGISPGVEWLEMLPLAVLLVAFTASCSLLLALVYVTVRDARPMWLVLTRVLFFATPVFYSIEVAPEGLARVMMMNPLAVVIVQARHALGLGSPSAADAIGGAVWLTIPAVITLALPCLAVWMYGRSRNLAERL
jgi:ABC-type polysaccharide/polyol phosphate transport system ATPase subunit/ABC-type polysaccharide/polyol phosphate export permease